VLDLDARAFDDFWTLDATGLDDAVRATQSSRFRVTQQRGEPITGYAITGRSLDRGYLQRLAVDPDRHRAGLGRALVADSLWWLRRTGAVVTLVNTQVVNEAAYALYRNCGFVDEPHGLTVLALDLAPERPAGTDAPGPST
jgi:GNAT superfamily N-acetyltransferase